MNEGRTAKQDELEEETRTTESRRARHTPDPPSY